MIRVVLATGRPAFDAAIATEPDFDVVAQAFYSDAALTAVAELQPDVAVIDPTLPGGDPIDWLGTNSPQSTQIVWLGRRYPGEPGRVRGSADCPGAIEASLEPRSVISAIRSLGAQRDESFPDASDVTPVGVQSFVGCLPRVGVTTAAAAFAVSIDGRRHSVAIIDANWRHPCLPEVLGFTPPNAGWEAVEGPGEISMTTMTPRGVLCVAMSRGLTVDAKDHQFYDRLKGVVTTLSERGRSAVVVDLGAPPPLQGGRLAAWVEWAASVGAIANLVLAQDPQALVAATRVLRAGDRAGLEFRLWCASYDEQISALADVSAALGKPCRVLPWDRRHVVRRALVGQPPELHVDTELRAEVDAPGRLPAAKALGHR